MRKSCMSGKHGVHFQLMKLAICAGTLSIITRLMGIYVQAGGVGNGTRPSTCRKKPHASGLRLQM